MKCEKSDFSKQGWLAAWLSREFQPRGNWTASCPILSCSAPASVTLQLLACLAREQLLAACSRESPARSSRESLIFLHTLDHFFTLFHSLPLQESYLNTRLLIAEIQANLARNKANKMVDKIQPYNYPSDTWLPGMKLGWDLRTGLERRLTAWKSPYDPSPGELSCRIELHNYREIVMKNGSKIYSRTGPWNGIRSVVHYG